MGLRKTCISSTFVTKEGFSLIEVVLVVAIMSLVLSATLFFTTSAYQQTAFLSERDALILLLQTARADALINKNQKPHGVFFRPVGYDGYVLFEGVDFAHSDGAHQIFVPASYPLLFGGSAPSEIVFSQLSGNASYEGSVLLIDGNRMAATVLITNYEGAVTR